MWWCEGGRGGPVNDPPSQLIAFVTHPDSQRIDITFLYEHRAKIQFSSNSQSFAIPSIVRSFIEQT